MIKLLLVIITSGLLIRVREREPKSKKLSNIVLVLRVLSMLFVCCAL